MGGALTKVDLGHGRGWAAPKPAASIRRIDVQLGRLADINEAGRSPEQADKNRAAWLAYDRYLKGGPWAPRAPYALGSDESVHCWGYAADSDDWYNARAAAVWRDNGWRQTARYPGNKAKDEPWHGEYSENLDNHLNDPAPSGDEVIIPKSKEDDDMSLIRWDRTGAIFVLGSEKIKYVATPEEAATLRRRHGQEINLSNEELTFQLNAENISWDVVEAVLAGRAQSGDGRFWSRLTAEGIAIRGEQAESQKTIDDVLKTAIRIEQGG